MNLKLNWLGLSVSDFDASFRFYTSMLGMTASGTKPDFAFFETTGMTFELFGGGISPSPNRSWGDGQAVRPCIQVTDLQRTISELNQRGVHFTGDIEQMSWGEQIEFMAPERNRWTLANAPSYPFEKSPDKPHIGWIEMKVHRLPEQQAFYCDVMGLKPEDGKDGQLILRQAQGEPHLLLESGGQPASPLQVSKGLIQPSPPHTISFETDNIGGAASWLESHKIPFVVDVTHRDWGGTELIIADRDGNPVQIVQYDTP